MLDKREGYLHCNQCDEETEHTVIYLEEKIRRIKCNQCDKTLGVDKKKLLERYAVETVEHILTEPQRLNKEIKEEGVGFLVSFPKRLLTKPYRVTKELLQVLKDE